MSNSPGKSGFPYLSGMRTWIGGILKPSTAPDSFRGETLAFRFGRHLFFLRDWMKSTRRRLRQWFKDPVTGLRLARFRRLIRNRRWDEALREVHVIAAVAEVRRNHRLMEEMGLALLRLGEYGESGRLRLESRRIRKPFPANEWKGEDLSGRVLLLDMVEDGSQALATTCLIAAASAGAKRCIVLAEPRLLPLIRRSLPGVDVHPAGVDDARARSEADVFATAAHLAAHFAANTAKMEAAFRPLVADPALAERFRSEYRGGDGKPLIGISWGSAAYAKDFPPLAEWVKLLRSVNATFVSLQYGKIDDDIAELRRGDEHKLIHDRTVDQLVDMDRFAAQIAAIDAVVSISNTGAHLTGALGVPAVLLSDDRFRRIWPVRHDRTPMYPRMSIVSRRGRKWSHVMEEARTRLLALIAGKLK